LSITLELGPALEATPLHLLPISRLTDEDFWEVCRRNPQNKIERSATGEIIIMPPASSEGSSKNADLIADLVIWARQDGTGIVFESSGGFLLPSGAKRSPEAAWVARARWDGLSAAQRRRFAPLCPDFVVELMSSSDRLVETQAKMDEYLTNGIRLGWLIDGDKRTVYVYRPGRPVEELTDAATISGDPELPGFVLHLARIF